VTMYYGLERARIDQLDAQASIDPLFERSLIGFQIKSGFGIAFERNTTDHPFVPTKGTYIGVALEYDSKDLGGSYNLFKQEYHAGVYYPLFWSFVGHLRGEVGLENSDGGVNSFPIFERFFLGGINSLRGWKFGEVGPLDSFGLVYGGDKYAVANAELLFPIMVKYGIRGVLFFDAGNAFAEGQGIDPGRFRTDVGPGIRWNSPFGPIRVEVGYKLDPNSNEKPFEFQFSAGAFF